MGKMCRIDSLGTAFSFSSVSSSSWRMNEICWVPMATGLQRKEWYSFSSKWACLLHSVTEDCICHSMLVLRDLNSSKIIIAGDSCCLMHCHWPICLPDTYESQMMVTWLSRFNYWVVLDLSVLWSVCRHVCCLMNLSGPHCGYCMLEPDSEQSQGG